MKAESERTSLGPVVGLLGVLVVGCANQTPVTPLLRVKPNAAARFLYFEKRAAAMLKEQGAVAEPETGEGMEETDEASGGGPDVPDATRGAPAGAPSEVVLRTWGVPPR